MHNDIVYIRLICVLLVLNYYIQTIPGKLHSVVVYLSVYFPHTCTCILCSILFDIRMIDCYGDIGIFH